MKLKSIFAWILALCLIVSGLGIPVAAAPDAAAPAAAARTTAHFGHKIADFNGTPACVNAVGNLHVCEINFPDANFRNYLLTDIRELWDGYLSPAEAENVRKIETPEGNISSLAGIEFFPFLTYLDCYGNALTELDLSGNGRLIDLICAENAIAALDLSQTPRLQTLYCSINAITALDVSHNPELIELSCADNGLTALDLSHNPALEYLSCSWNNLTVLDVSHNPKLIELFCHTNHLAALDLSNNPALEYLYCDDNNLTALKLPNAPALEELYCSWNNLTTLDLSHAPALQTVYCHTNALKKLELSGNGRLTLLDCEGNDLAALDLSQTPQLQNLNCVDNDLAALDLSHNPRLQTLFCQGNRLAALDLSHTPALEKLYCASNCLTMLDLSGLKKLSTCFVGWQTSTGTVKEQNGKWVVDLASVVGRENLKNIAAVYYGTWDPAAGTATFDYKPERVKYDYDTGYPDALLEVTLLLTQSPADRRYTATIDGVDREYAPGDTFFISATTFYTHGGWAYRFAGWSGDTDCLADPSSAFTSFVMPARDIVLSSTYILVGDVNGDGVLSAGDVLLLARMLSGSVPGNAAADIDGDGMLSAGDMVFMRRYLAGTYVPTK